MDATHGTSPGKGARWVCPNDRQLALRAKLRTGWSVKSSSFDARFTDFNYSTSCPGNLNTSSASTPFALSDAEKASIIQVIQRAEALDISEQERVGRLVERLENMKRNVSTATTTRSSGRSCGSRCSGNNGCVCSCALCGEKFAVLGAGPSLCRDCRKYICQKCGIETSPSYLGLPGNSTAPTTTSASGAATGAQQQQHNAAVSHFRLRPAGTINNKLFLCRICAETREMWKKSGAWFIRGLPKYVLPEKKERGRSRAGSRASGWTLAGGTKSLEPPERDSSSDDEATRRMTRTRSLLSASVDVEVLPGETSTTPVPPSPDSRAHLSVSRSGNNSSSSATSEYDRRPSGEYSSTEAPESSGKVTSSASTNTIKSKSAKNRRRSNSEEQRENEPSGHQASSLGERTSSIGGHQSRVTRSPSANTVKSKSNGQRGNARRSISEEHKDTEENNSTNVTQVHHPSGINANNGSILSIDLSNRVAKEASSGLSGNSRMSESSFDLVKHYEHNQKQLVEEEEGHQQERLEEEEEEDIFNCLDLPRIKLEEPVGYGTLQIELRFVPASLCLQCRVIRARDLRPMDIHGLADPFCRLIILPKPSSSTTSKLLRTKTVHKTRNPEFNEQLNFYGITQSDMRTDRALHVQLLQDDQVARDFLGEARFPLYEVPSYRTKYYKVFLADRYPERKEEKAWSTEQSTNGKGQIQLRMRYSTHRRALLVTVERAFDLLFVDRNGATDPFVKLSLTKEQQTEEVALMQSTIVNSMAKKASRKLAISSSRNSNVRRTSVKWSTRNPEWNEEFAFETPRADLKGLALVISVIDKSVAMNNARLGHLTLSCNSKGARLRHWIDMIKFPDQSHWGCHNLIGD